MRQGFLWVGLAAAVFGLATLAQAPSAGAQETKMLLGVPSGEITVGGAPFTVDVLVENVVNLGAFEFTLGYDASVLEFVSVEKSGFLGSSGRRVECLDPRVSPGSVRLVCVTLGATPPGPDGSAVLATLTFTPAAAGTSPLRFDKGILALPDGERISATNENASVSVTLPGAARTPTPTGASPVPTSAQLTPAAATPTAPTSTATTPVAPTPTPVGTPVTTTSASDGGTNWVLWGSIIGVAAVLVLAAAGTLWWSRTRKPS